LSFSSVLVGAGSLWLIGKPPPGPQGPAQLAPGFFPEGEWPKPRGSGVSQAPAHMCGCWLHLPDWLLDWERRLRNSSRLCFLC